MSAGHTTSDRVAAPSLHEHYDLVVVGSLSRSASSELGTSTGVATGATAAGGGAANPTTPGQWASPGLFAAALYMLLACECRCQVQAESNSPPAAKRHCCLRPHVPPTQAIAFPVPPPTLESPFAVDAAVAPTALPANSVQSCKASLPSTPRACKGAANSAGAGAAPPPLESVTSDLLSEISACLRGAALPCPVDADYQPVLGGCKTAWVA